ncbi:MAG: ribose-phosphate pyrophosphokinase [Oligoflexia bacterium]|nr:ribose-phosphate pyrophosphokinase [Oligoflexia bacterium]
MASSTPTSLQIFAGTSNQPLAEKIAQSLGVDLSKADFRRFSDNEIFVEIQESVRGKNVYLVQSTCAPVNDNLMELLVTVDTMKRASVSSITAVMPYYGYARQDRKVQPRTPITAKLVADLLTAAGVDRVVSLDLHSGQIQGFFNIPFDNLFARPVLLNYIRENLCQNGQGEELVIVSPDAGGVERARAYAKKVNAKVAMIDKRRTGPNVAKAMHVVGEVQGMKALILDDMVDTAGTLTEAAESLKKNGATEIYACCTHPVLSGPAIKRIKESCIKKLVCTDTIPLSQEAKDCGKIEVLTVAGLLAEAIRRIHFHDSVSSLFD